MNRSQTTTSPLPPPASGSPVPEYREREQGAPLDYASPLTTPRPPRLLSLDVFRGLVILAMLIVNNIGDGGTTGYFWKHADWPAMSMRHAWRAWWGYATREPYWQKRATDFWNSEQQIGNELLHGVFPPATWRIGRELNESELVTVESRSGSLAVEGEIAAAPWSHIPLFTYCTLADYVMPSFMLIIGVAIPFSVAAAKARSVPPKWIWLRAFKRAALLVLLGWILCYFRDQFAASLYGQKPWTFSFGMDVLQLLGVGYLVARILYELPPLSRAAAAAVLFLWHWAILRFYPQGIAPAGTFTEHYEAIGYIYQSWPIWNWLTLHVGPVTIGWRGLMSVPPAAATMLFGTLMGDWLRRSDVDPPRKVARLAFAGFALAIAGVLWALDLPFNKPRWTPCYLVYVAGVDAMLIALLYWIIDIRHIRKWTYPLVVFGTNALALYFISIMFKVLILNTPRVHMSTGKVPLIDAILSSLKHALGPWAGGWTYTILFIAFWWIVLDQMYRRKIFWRL